MVDILASITLNALADKYSIKGNKEWIVELDSSTEEKFSRHLVIRIPKTGFKDNSHVGAFIIEVCSRIGNLRASDPQTDKLYTMKDPSTPDSPRQLFIDTAVYSRNRCFRLALSSKAGKNSFLLPTGRFKCKNMSDQQVFLESLICRMDADCDKLLICKPDVDCQKILCFDSEVHEQTSNITEKLALNSCRSDVTKTYFSGKSPFPALDDFVELIASSGNTPGRIRCWYWFSADGLMVYSMLRNRYCERIGREHKSNHVMYIVDFRMAGYYQKCYDPDCKGYRSPLRQLPWDVIPANMSLINSTRAENYCEMVNVDDLQLVGNNSDQCHSDEWTESSWWQEAISYVDCIENMGIRRDLSSLDVSTEEDIGWWIDVEKIVSQVEERIS